MKPRGHQQAVGRAWGAVLVTLWTVWSLEHAVVCGTWDVQAGFGCHHVVCSRDQGQVGQIVTLTPGRHCREQPKRFQSLLPGWPYSGQFGHHLSVACEFSCGQVGRCLWVSSLGQVGRCLCVSSAGQVGRCLCVSSPGQVGRYLSVSSTP